jgi:branched-chain amino acid transport system permease protein
MVFFQYVINGIAIGSQYALVGLAAMFVVRVTQVINFAVGGLVVLAGLLAAVTFEGIPPIVVLIMLIVLGAPAAMLLHIVSTRLLNNNDPDTGILVTVATATALQGLGYYFYGPELKVADAAIPLKTFRIGDELTATSGTFQLLGAVVLSFIACWFTLERTGLGRSLRAVSDDPEAARIIGIKVRTVVYSAHGILGILCFFIGGLLAQVNGTTPDRVFPILIGALFGLVIGGSDRVIGPVVGGLSIGIIESVAFSRSGSQFGAAVVVLIGVLGMLMIAPGGIFQTRTTRAVG